MGKKNKKKTRKKSGQWTPPKDSSSFFYASSDYEFKEAHPVGYGFLVMLGIAALLLPVILYMVFVIPIADNSPWIMLGWVGGFVIGIGLFNFVAIIIKTVFGTFGFHYFFYCWRRVDLDQFDSIGNCVIDRTGLMICFA